jgi:hypothetical protein
MLIFPEIVHNWKQSLHNLLDTTHPAGMISRLRYEILITEIKAGQKADEALQDNMSFFNSADVAK